MKIIIHVLNVDNYFPELTKLTFPTIEAWANKIHADVNYITKRKYPDWPVEYEKLQIYQDGKDADWNILCDADILIHPDMYNPVDHIHPIQVATKDSYKADNQLKMCDYFFRDQRNIGISGCFVMASRICHDLWEPLDMTWEECKPNLTYLERNADEYCLSRNLAKYGLKYTSIFKNVGQDYKLLYHLGQYGQDQNQILKLANEWVYKYK